VGHGSVGAPERGELPEDYSFEATHHDDAGHRHPATRRGGEPAARGPGLVGPANSRSCKRVCGPYDFFAEGVAVPEAECEGVGVAVGGGPNATFTLVKPSDVSIC
jgi:hypothetical protein